MFSRRKKHGKINWSRNRLLLNQLIICDQVDKYLEIYVYPTMVGGGVNFMDLITYEICKNWYRYIFYLNKKKNGRYKI